MTQQNVSVNYSEDSILRFCMSLLTANRADKSTDKGVLEEYYYYYYHHHHHHHLSFFFFGRSFL